MAKSKIKQYWPEIGFLIVVGLILFDIVTTLLQNT